MIPLSFSLSASLSLPLDSMAIGGPLSSSSLKQPLTATALPTLATGDPPPSLSLHPPPETHPLPSSPFPRPTPLPLCSLSLSAARFNDDRCRLPSPSLEQTSAATALPPTAVSLSGADVHSYRPPSPFIPLPRPTNLPLCFSLSLCHSIQRRLAPTTVLLFRATSRSYRTPSPFIPLPRSTLIPSSPAPTGVPPYCDPFPFISHPQKLTEKRRIMSCFQQRRRRLCHVLPSAEINNEEEDYAMFSHPHKLTEKRRTCANVIL